MMGLRRQPTPLLVPPSKTWLYVRDLRCSLLSSFDLHNNACLAEDDPASPFRPHPKSKSHTGPLTSRNLTSHLVECRRADSKETARNLVRIGGIDRHVSDILPRSQSHWLISCNNRMPTGTDFKTLCP
jgi:hypothetical protein